MHGLGNARDFREVVYDVLVAVDVLFEYLPVVDARLPRRSGVEENEALIDLVERNRHRLPADSVWPKMHCAHTAVHRRIIILAAGGYADQLGFDILRNHANLFDIDRAPYKSRQGRSGGDHQGRRTGDARAGGRFRMCFQQEPRAAISPETTWAAAHSPMSPSVALPSRYSISPIPMAFAADAAAAAWPASAWSEALSLHALARSPARPRSEGSVAERASSWGSASSSTRPA